MAKDGSTSGIWYMPDMVGCGWPRSDSVRYGWPGRQMSDQIQPHLAKSVHDRSGRIESDSAGALFAGHKRLLGPIGSLVMLLGYGSSQNY